MAEQGALSCIDSHKEELKSLSHEIWKNPEVGSEEHKSHAIITDYLESKGFKVERKYCGVPTAFRATAGKPGATNVCFICEYDALPGIGHACGHNLIAEAGVAAGLGLKDAIELGGLDGRVTVMGTPDEEGNGGKIELLEKGAFKGVDIAMMVHPSPITAIHNQYLATCEIVVTYTGKAAHAAAFPWEGINALDAAVMAYNAISTLRQQMKPDWRVHGIITKGGVKPNIIPETSSLIYWMRAPTRNELKYFRSKVIACFKGAAMATNCTVDITDGRFNYENVLTNPILGKIYEKHLRSFGYHDIIPKVPGGSTDMGNVSHVIPSIHPEYAIGDGISTYHTASFTGVSNEADSHDKTLLAAKAMVLTSIEALQSKSLLAEIKKIFEEEKNIK